MKLSPKLSARTFEVARDEEVSQWIREIEHHIGGVRWIPVGGIDNNVHTVEVASDPALALVERPTNSIDAVLDLRARERGETSPTPHDAAKKWFGVPADGITGMEDKDRRALADFIQVTMHESGTPERPTITIQDQGIGQHPDDFADTLLSLLASNKKRLTHVMGVYNAGGAASYKFAKWTVIAARLAPTLLERRTDEIGLSIVRYNPLDAERYKSGVYEYLVDREGKILRLDLADLPILPYGTYVKLVEYLIPKYAKGAHQPKQSLWHLFHAALPNPALPFRIIETRAERFAGMKGGIERRVVTGLRHLLTREGTADYRDERSISLGPDGSVVLSDFVLNEGADPDAYTTSEQGLTLMLNGQRQFTKDRLWVRRQLNLYYLYKRLVVFIDGTGLTSAAKRDVFASTRETSVDTPLTKKILDRVIQELKDDEELYNLDELARQKTLQDATRTTTEKVKRELASRIGAFLKGQFGGTQGGDDQKKKKKKRRKKRKPTAKPPRTDDSMMLDVPDKLAILTNPLEIGQGETEGLRLGINAKNGFLPKYANNLSVIVGPELKDHVKVVSTGRLLGGHVRVSLEAAPDAPVVTASLRVALVVPDLGVLLTADGVVEVTAPDEEEDDDNKTGGAPNVEISWVGREKWDTFPVPWNDATSGECNIYRDDPATRETITKVEWTLNEAFAPYEKTVAAKKLSETALKTFRERYEIPIAIGFFHQALAERELEASVDGSEKPYDIPERYARAERGRLARAVLMALEPDLHVHEVGDVGGD